MKLMSQPLFELVPLAANHDAVSVAVGLGAGDHRPDQAGFESANALEKVVNLFVLEPQLRWIFEVLVLASAAFSEIAARRLDSLGRMLGDAQKFRAGKSLFYLRNLRFHDLAGSDKGHEYDELIESGNAFPTESDVLDG